MVESLARIAGKDCCGKGFEQEAFAAISRDLQLHTCSHWLRARYLGHTLVLGWHRTRRGDSSIGLQRCEQLGAGFTCGAAAFDESDTHAECAWHSATAAWGRRADGGSAPASLAGLVHYM